MLFCLFCLSSRTKRLFQYYRCSVQGAVIQFELLAFVRNVAVKSGNVRKINLDVHFTVKTKTNGKRCILFQSFKSLDMIFQVDTFVATLSIAITEFHNRRLFFLEDTFSLKVSNKTYNKGITIKPKAVPNNIP